MAITTDEPVKALVGFGPKDVGLYLLPASDKSSFLRRHLILEMSRDGGKGEDDINVQYVRRLADAINEIGVVNPTTGHVADAKVPA